MSKYFGFKSFCWRLQLRNQHIHSQQHLERKSRCRVVPSLMYVRSKQADLFSACHSLYLPDVWVLLEAPRVAAAPETAKVLCCCSSSSNYFCLCAGGIKRCSSSEDIQGAVLLQFFNQLFLSFCWRHQALQQLQRHPRCCVVAVLQTFFVCLLEASSVAAAPKTSKVLCSCSSSLNSFCLSAGVIKHCSSSKDIQGAVLLQFFKEFFLSTERLGCGVSVGGCFFVYQTITLFSMFSMSRFLNFSWRLHRQAGFRPTATGLYKYIQPNGQTVFKCNLTN